MMPFSITEYYQRQFGDITVSIGYTRKENIVKTLSVIQITFVEDSRVTKNIGAM